MADDNTLMQRLVVSLEARIDKYEKDLERAKRGSNQKFKDIGKSGDDFEKKITNQFRNSGRAIAALDGPLGGIASRFSSVSSLVSGAGLAFGAAALAIGATTFAANKALDSFQKFEKQQLTTQAVLRATGGSAGLTAAAIEELSRSIGMNTLASTTAAREAATQLLTFRSVSGDTFRRTLKLSQDLAAVGFGTLQSSAVQLGKALEDPTSGLAALRRVGVSFSAAQTQVIRDLHDTGRTAEAQTMILDQLEKQVGGAGVAGAGGLAGAYDSLAEATQILLERWGSQIAQALNLQSAILGIASAIDEVNQRADFNASAAGRLFNATPMADTARQILATEDPNDPMGARAIEEAKRVLQEFHDLQMDVFREADANSLATVRAMEAQAEAARERALGVISGLEQELSLAGKTNLERQIALKLAEAGVTAETELGKQIIANLTAIEQAQEALKKANSSGSSAASLAQKNADALANYIDLLEHERKLIGLSAVDQRILNDLRALSIELTSDQGQAIAQMIRALESEKAAFDESTDAIERRNKQIEDTLSTISKSISELFEDGIVSFDAFLDRILTGFARIADTNLGELFSVDSWNASAAEADGYEYARMIKKATAEGSRAGIFDGFMAFANTQTPGGLPLSGVLSAGAGGLGLGYQSADPIMGGLGGALQGAGAGMAFGPVGMAVGALVGGLAGFAGGSVMTSQKFQEMKERFA